MYITELIKTVSQSCSQFKFPLLISVGSEQNEREKDLSDGIGSGLVNNCAFSEKKKKKKIDWELKSTRKGQ